MDRPLTEGRTRAITKEGPTQINPSSKNTFTIKFKFILFLSLDMFFSRVFIKTSSKITQSHNRRKITF